jgi:hypothetical protein
MQPVPHRRSRSGFLWVLLGFLGAFAFVVSLLATDDTTPGIYLIEPIRTNEVAIHINTISNRVNTLQYSDSLASSAHWTNLGNPIPALPFSVHAAYTDTRLAPQRFYRLVTN